MARLPSTRYLMQQVGGNVILFEDSGTEEVLVKFDPTDRDATARAQKDIHDIEDMSDEDKSFAHFWAGYFYAHANELSPPVIVTALAHNLPEEPEQPEDQHKAQFDTVEEYNGER